MNLPLRFPERPHAADTGPAFDYSAAFSRNIGWITEWEQQELRSKTVAIAGMGGVGGAHAMTLARLGIGGFHIADLDRFDLVNMNRQAGAFLSTLDREKTAVMAEMTKDINPELHLKTFPEGVNDDNLDSFLSGVDLFVDGLDFFVLDVRRKVFRRCAERGIPAITAAPIGFSSGYLIFMPGGMSFEEYFRLEGLSTEQKYVNFALGLTPKAFHRRYMLDSSRVDFVGKRAPSTAAAIQLCAGIVGSESIKILLSRGKIYAAPYYHQFDAYKGQWTRGKLRFGNAGPIQSLKRRVGYRAFAQLSRNARPAEAEEPKTEIEQILNVARWAPSGDNTQPWRFELVGDDRVIVHVRSPKDDIYDYDGRPTLVAVGAMLETIRIAASQFGRDMQWDLLSESGTERIDLFLPYRRIERSTLFPYVTIRSVDRNQYRHSPLSRSERAILEDAIGPDFAIRWHDGLGHKWRASTINALASDIRLRLRAAYDVHRRVMDWSGPFSRTGIPVKAIGLDRFTLGLMRFTMASWERMRTIMQLPGSTIVVRAELDLIPGLSCAAHFSLHARRESSLMKDPKSMSLMAGQAIQRFWLTATAMGLAMQPTMAPLIFAWYAAAKTDLGSAALNRKAVLLAKKLAATEGYNTSNSVFRGRIGRPAKCPPVARSLRRFLRELVVYEGEAVNSSNC